MKYEFIGWCYDEARKHDKVWGVILLQEDVPVDSSAWPFRTNKYVSFWGRRGKKLSTKMINGSDYDIEQVIRKKKREYSTIDKNRLNEVYPEFQSDLEKTAIWATLKL